jgi:hypothetical protein
MKDKMAMVRMAADSFSLPPNFFCNIWCKGKIATAIITAHSTGMINGNRISKQ